VKRSYLKAETDKLTDEEKKALPIFGNISHGVSSDNTDANANAEPSKVFSPGDNLPF
jgi:hypothetical protein